MQMQAEPQVGTTAILNPGIQIMLNIGFQNLLHHIHFDSGLVLEQDDDEQWQLLGKYGEPPIVASLNFVEKLSQLPTEPTIYAISSVDLVHIPTLEDSIDLQSKPEDAQFALGISLPLTKYARGLLLLYTRDESNFEAITPESLQPYTKLFQLILAQDSSGKQDTNHPNELQARAAISDALKGANTAAEIAPIFLRKIVELLNVQGCTMFRFEEQMNHLRLWATYPQKLKKHVCLPFGQGFIGKAARSRTPTFLGDTISQAENQSLVQTDVEMCQDEVDALTAESDLVALAMETNQGQLIGVLAIHLQEHQSLLAEEVSLIEAIATMAANVLNRASEKDSLEQKIAERTKELLIANEQLLELDRLKNKFIEDMSHEFRTPLTSIGLYLGLLEKEATEKSTRYIEALKRQTTQLSSLVNTILDISNTAHSGDLVEFEVVDLADIMRDLFKTYEVYAEAHNLELSWEQSDSCFIYGNPEVVRRMISNLLDNAISYTPQGSVQIRLEVVDNRASLSVMDTGLGIPPEEVALLFERFYRGKQVSQLNIPGSGLGLSMVKQIIEQHNGEIEVESVEGKGSTFRIWLPVATQTKTTQLAVA
ncbi:MAG: GAF domain-containing sensor histidine kinase [Chloroflexota bacterium]